MDTEFNIYKIIKKEKRNINNVNYNNLPKIFNKYYYKFILIIKSNLSKNNNVELFNIHINNISNLLFEIFWIIFLGSFNNHITIFFLERASILFYEFINLASNNKNYKVQNINIVYDSILFTFNKTLGNTTLKQIINENTIQNNYMLNKINIVRDWSYISVIIINNIVKEDYNNKNTNILLYNIYNINKNININKYLIYKFNSIFDNFNLDKSLFIIKTITDTINYFININFFKFNKTNTDIENFINYFDTSLDNFIYQETFLNNPLNSPNINKKNIYMKFKDSILRYINY